MYKYGAVMAAVMKRYMKVLRNMCMKVLHEKYTKHNLQKNLYELEFCFMHLQP